MPFFKVPTLVAPVEVSFRTFRELMMTVAYTFSTVVTTGSVCVCVSPQAVHSLRCRPSCSVVGGVTTYQSP